MELALLDLVAVGLGLTASLTGAIHALLSKQDPRSAAAWVTLCLLFPLVGVLVYAAIGNNRISTRAQRLHAGQRSSLMIEELAGREILPADAVEAPYRNLERLARAVSGNSLLGYNRVDPLCSGAEAYAAMLQAIDAADSSVLFSSYIFEPHGIGERFVDALATARRRGVQVRVLVDGVGERYSFPTISNKLHRRGIPVRRFLPPRLIPPNFSINLRNHRKILVVDDRLAFTGGMNIRNKVLPDQNSGRPAVIDLHFRVEGPVVTQIRQVFVDDWLFSGGEPPEAPVYESAVPVGEAHCRVVTDGPSENLDKLTWVLIGAISAAQFSIKIMTPYFLPSRVLAIALQTATLRGAQVDIILPRRNNLRFMNWAAWHVIRPLVGTGVRVHFFDGPFVHSKLFLVDDYYVQLGSANLDPRSLRLNFELAVEVFDADLGGKMADHFANSLASSRLVSRHDLARRDPLRRLRDAIVWLFSPYL